MIIAVKGLTKIYKMGVERIHALAGVDLAINANEFVAIMGASGSGKSTLMNMLGLLDRPTSGKYILNGQPTHKMSAGDLSSVRNKEIGFVFQTFELLPRASALRNVMLPLLYSQRGAWGARKKAKLALERVGLGDRLDHRPNQMSGGQRQRVAIARALVNEPAIVLADEPTGNLDTSTSRDIMRLLTELHEQGQTIIVVTHEEDVAAVADRIVRLRDGRVVSDHPTSEDPTHRRWLESVADQFHHRLDVEEQAARAGAPLAAGTASKRPVSEEART